LSALLYLELVIGDAFDDQAWFVPPGVAALAFGARGDPSSV
jgi:hypothetical protein